MSEKNRDFQLTSDDPMLEQIDAATTTSGEAAHESASAPSAEATGDGGRAPAVETGEPPSAQFEPDASQ